MRLINANPRPFLVRLLFREGSDSKRLIVSCISSKKKNGEILLHRHAVLQGKREGGGVRQAKEG
jgi:hypothetical protein